MCQPLSAPLSLGRRCTYGYDLGALTPLSSAALDHGGSDPAGLATDLHADLP